MPPSRRARDLGAIAPFSLPLRALDVANFLPVRLALSLSLSTVYNISSRLFLALSASPLRQLRVNPIAESRKLEGAELCRFQIVRNCTTIVAGARIGEINESSGGGGREREAVRAP